MKSRQLLPKDLLNDLERAENVKERIMKQLAKKVDQPQYRMDTSLLEPLSWVATSAVSFAISSSFRGW